MFLNAFYAQAATHQNLWLVHWKSGVMLANSVTSATGGSKVVNVIIFPFQCGNIVNNPDHLRKMSINLTHFPWENLRKKNRFPFQCCNKVNNSEHLRKKIPFPDSLFLGRIWKKSFKLKSLLQISPAISRVFCVKLLCRVYQGSPINIGPGYGLVLSGNKP